MGISQWVVLVLYSFAGALFSYFFNSDFTSGSLATAAGYQFLISIVST